MVGTMHILIANICINMNFVVIIGNALDFFMTLFQFINYIYTFFRNA